MSSNNAQMKSKCKTPMVLYIFLFLFTSPFLAEGGADSVGSRQLHYALLLSIPPLTDPTSPGGPGFLSEGSTRWNRVLGQS